MSFATYPLALSGGNQVIGASGKKAPTGIGVKRALLTISGAANQRDIAYEPALGSGFNYMTVGGPGTAPYSAASALSLIGTNGVAFASPFGTGTNFANGVDGNGLFACYARGNGKIVVVGSATASGLGQSGVYLASSISSAPTQTSDVVGKLYTCLAYAGGTTWLAGESDMLRSTDDGVTWTTTVLGNDGGFSGTVNGIARVGNSSVIHFARGTGYWRVSNDAGATWNYWGAGGGHPGQAPLDIAANSSGVIIGIGNTTGGGMALIWRSNDGGASASQISNPRNIALRSICTLPSGKFLAAGDNRGDGKPYVLLGSADGLTWTDKDTTALFPAVNIARVNKVRYLPGVNRVFFLCNATLANTGVIASTNEFL